MSATDAPEQRRILVVGAHPDDIDFGCSGSVATWVDAGHHVEYLVVTDGQAGGFDVDLDRAEMPRIRREEQRAAAAAVGVERVHFLGYDDGRLEVTIALRRDISRIIRRVRPDRVVCQSPVRNLDSTYGSHPDHIAAGEATMCAVYPDARNPFAHPELLDDEHLEPWKAAEVWIAHGPGAERTYVDVTDVIDRKLDAILAHTSQHPDPGGLPERIRQWGRRVADEGGLPEGRLAEVFRIVDTR